MSVVRTSADHELLHARVADQIHGYVALSHAHASAGDTRSAVLSQWAADVSVLQCLLWESGLGDAPDPDAQLAAVGEAVQGSLQAYAAEPPSISARETVEHARAALTGTFDASVHSQLAERFEPIDHLDGLAAPVTGAARHANHRRFIGRKVPDLVADLLDTASDCRAVAQVMAAVGRQRDARDQMWMADLASFEAYLVQAAEEVGDTTFATVDLRWNQAVRVLAEKSAGPEKVRDCLLHVVCPTEQAGLSATFGQLATALA